MAGKPVPPSGFDKGFDPADPGWRFGIRLALQDVAGIDDRMIDSLLTGRPFTSVTDLRRRAALSAPVAESLAHAGALDELAGVGLPFTAVPGRARESVAAAAGRAPGIAAAGGRAPGSVAGAGGRAQGGVTAAVRTRRDLLLEVTERWSGLSRHRVADPAAPEQLGLLGTGEPPGLAEYRSSDRVRAELEVLGMDASDHVIRFYDGLLDRVEVTRAGSLLSCRNGARVRVAGVKVATQTPPVKSGQRIIFLSLDDATGVSDATFFESVHDRCAWTVFHTWLLVVEGTVHRTGKRGVSLNAEVVWDLRRLMRAWREGWLDDALAENRAVRPGRLARPIAEAARDFSDQAPAGIAGAPGRSGLRLGPGDAPFGGRAPGSGQAFVDGRQVAAELRDATGRPDAGQVNGKSLAGLRAPGLARPRDAQVPAASQEGSRRAGLHPGDVSTPAARVRVSRNAPYGPPPVPAPDAGEVGAPSRVGPNGTTWADPTGRNGNIEDADLYRLPLSDPRHPRHQPQRPPADPHAPPSEAEPPRKLWHSSSGSAGG